MEIRGKTIIYGILILAVLLLLFISFGVINFNSGESSQSVSGTSKDIPENCQIPSGQDLESWKEHLGHHAETRDCLKYFN